MRTRGDSARRDRCPDLTLDHRDTPTHGHVQRRARRDATGPNAKERRGIQSVETGGELLRSLTRHASSMMLKDLARDAGMAPAKAHPYLVSFAKLGLVEQDPATGRYELGPFALELGLVGMRRLEPVRVASREVAALADRTGQSVAMAVWGTHGPTVIRLDESTHPIHVNLRPGTVMSLVHTATGRVFAAYLPPKVTEHLVDAELDRGALSAAERRTSAKEFAATLATIRERGIARATGHPIPGINAFCAPVFDHTRSLVLAITLLGPAGTFDASWQSPLARELATTAERVAARLGYRP